MQWLEIDEIIRLIKAGKTFEATSASGGFTIKINRYVPYICTAIHDGSNLRDELKEKIALDEYSRWYEEDPYTGEFIDSLPITITGNDSRYEYDLNRSPETCVFETAWGKNVWKKKLTLKDKKLSIKKHKEYYRVLHTLVSTLEKRFEGCVVYDLHSYNHVRWERDVPLFNIGIENIDSQRYETPIQQWKGILESIELENVENVCGINDVFYGRGYNLEYITKNFKNTLVLATEIKKVYCNEVTGEEYPSVIRTLQHQFKKAFLKHAYLFCDVFTNWRHDINISLLDKKKDPDLFKIDTQLYRLVKNFELLAIVNPKNSQNERKKFFKNKTNYSPVFQYQPIKIDGFELKQKLSRLNTKKISDISIREMYESVINSYNDKIDLLTSLNSEKFLYNSLRYFGRPNKTDLLNAEYLLHLPPVPGEPIRTPKLPMEEVIELFQSGIKDYNIQCKLEVSNKLLSKVMVLNSQKLVRINANAQFSRKEVGAMIEHEIGVHMVTTHNSNEQDLKIFNLGLPVNTMTQEGLAILSEYLSGNLTLNRLKKLALRVLVTDMMCSGADFRECYKELTENHGVTKDDAFTIVTRIFRGGGFTKDYLYLKGFAKIHKLYENNVDLTPLMLGKTSVEFLPTIKEMLNRDVLKAPTHVTKSIFESAITPFPIYRYIVSGLR